LSGNNKDEPLNSEELSELDDIVTSEPEQDSAAEVIAPEADSVQDEELVRCV